jgi:hypothetical protein
VPFPSLQEIVVSPEIMDHFSCVSFQEFYRLSFYKLRSMIYFKIICCEVRAEVYIFSIWICNCSALCVEKTIFSPYNHLGILLKFGHLCVCLLLASFPSTVYVSTQTTLIILTLEHV